MKSAIILLALTQTALAFAIYHGQPVDAVDQVYASTVVLMVPEKDSYAAKCSGTIVSPRLVIAAAHCIAQHDYSQIVVGFGSDPLHSHLYSVSHVAYPSGYYDSQVGTLYRGLDIAVFQIAEPFAAPLHPVLLARRAGEPVQGSMIQAGFGYGDLAEKTGLGDLRKLTGAKVSHDSLDPDQPTQQFTLTNGTDASTLRGDSGGPLYVMEMGALSLRGVLAGGGGLSRRDTNGRVVREMLSIYTDTVYFHDWLNCATGGSFATSIGLPPQIRCRRLDRLFPITSLATHNEDRCGSWPGWVLIARPGESYRSTCWPGTRKACEEYAKSSRQPLNWQDSDQSCR